MPTFCECTLFRSSESQEVISNVTALNFSNCICNTKEHLRNVLEDECDTDLEEEMRSGVTFGGVLLGLLFTPTASICMINLMMYSFILITAHIIVALIPVL